LRLADKKEDEEPGLPLELANFELHEGATIAGAKELDATHRGFNATIAYRLEHHPLRFLDLDWAQESIDGFYESVARERVGGGRDTPSEPPRARWKQDAYEAVRIDLARTGEVYSAPTVQTRLSPSL
ncbi:uncharacterized protein JCM6883_006404, partial [Sporobolomyces salmoneus]|uniref:uncharacterized protein n=1 Tax=Sporobolomyces salmoneus TaxID=183962 RepID=UPI00316DB478